MWFLPPGGANDFLARVLAEQIGRAQGVAFTVENRTGAGGIIGAEAVSRSAPDGSILLLDSNSLLIDALVQKTNYHPLTRFEPICNLVDAPTVITVNAASPYRKLSDLIDAARARPREITLATVGPGGTFRIGFERLRRAANVDITFVPYPGIAPAVNARLGGHVSFVFSTYSTVSDQVNAGRLRALATGSPSVSGRCRGCRPSLNPVTRITKSTNGSACGLLRRRRRKLSRKSPGGSPQRYRRSKSSRSLSARGSFQ